MFALFVQNDNVMQAPLMTKDLCCLTSYDGPLLCGADVCLSILSCFIWVFVFCWYHARNFPKYAMRFWKNNPWRNWHLYCGSTIMAGIGVWCGYDHGALIG